MKIFYIVSCRKSTLMSIAGDFAKVHFCFEESHGVVSKSCVRVWTWGAQQDWRLQQAAQHGRLASQPCRLPLIRSSTLLSKSPGKTKLNMQHDSILCCFYYNRFFIFMTCKQKREDSLPALSSLQREKWTHVDKRTWSVPNSNGLLPPLCSSFSEIKIQL